MTVINNRIQLAAIQSTHYLSKFSNTCLNGAIKFHSNYIIVFQVLIIKEQWKEHSILNTFSNTRLTVGTMKIGYRLFASKAGDHKKNENMWCVYIYNYRHKYYHELGQTKDRSSTSTPSSSRGLTTYWAQAVNQANTHGMCKHHWNLIKKRK